MDASEIRAALERAGLSAPKAAELLDMPVWTLRAYIRNPGEASARPAPSAFREHLAAMLDRHATTLHAMACELRDNG